MPDKKRYSHPSNDKQQTILFDCEETPKQAEESSHTASIEELNNQNRRALRRIDQAAQAVQSMRFISFGSRFRMTWSWRHLSMGPCAFPIPEDVFSATL